MNVDTGHLMYAEKAPTGYTPVPDELRDEVKRALGDSEEGYVDIKGPSPLSAWAKQQRKNRNKIAKSSRSKNRSR
jgi:hypothetical protein